jgi:hypothetical protein
MPLLCSTPDLLLGGVHLAFHREHQQRFGRYRHVQVEIFLQARTDRPIISQKH